MELTKDFGNGALKVTLCPVEDKILVKASQLVPAELVDGRYHSQSFVLERYELEAFLAGTYGYPQSA